MSRFIRKPMTVNIHTHTFRCGHAAEDSDREYVESAIAAGFKVLGFSDHAPGPLENGRCQGHCIKPEMHLDYVESILSLKEEYAGQIDIKLGYEMEYYPKFFDGFMKTMTKYPVDYLILGQHFTNNHDDGIHAYRTTDDRDVFAGFIDQEIEAMETGVFTYVAHPDIMNFADDRVYYEEFSRLAIRSKELGIPLEINLLGMRGEKTYPNERFVKLCGEIGTQMCIGSDAHSADVVWDSVSYERAMRWAEKYDVDILYEPVLREVKWK